MGLAGSGVDGAGETLKLWPTRRVQLLATVVGLERALNATLDNDE